MTGDYTKVALRASERWETAPVQQGRALLNHELNLGHDASVRRDRRLARDAIAVTCDSRRLGEVRICVGRDLRFRSCPEIDARACRREKVMMPPVRGGGAAAR